MYIIAFVVLCMCLCIIGVGAKSWIYCCNIEENTSPVVLCVWVRKVGNTAVVSGIHHCPCSCVYCGGMLFVCVRVFACVCAMVALDEIYLNLNLKILYAEYISTATAVRRNKQF